MVVVVVVVVVLIVVLIVVEVAAAATVVDSVGEATVVVIGSRVSVVADNSVAAAKSVVFSSFEVVVTSDEEESVPDASTRLFWPCCTKAYKSSATLSMEDGYSVVGFSVFAEIVEGESESSYSRFAFSADDCLSLAFSVGEDAAASSFSSPLSSLAREDPLVSTST